MGEEFYAELCELVAKYMERGMPPDDVACELFHMEETLDPEGDIPQAA